MPMPTTQIQNCLGMAYVQAVAAAAGVIYIPPSPTENGVDCQFQRSEIMPDGRYTQTGISLSGQVKSTTTWIEEPDNIVYDLESVAYNKLTIFEGPIILVLFRMPKNQQDWLSCTERVLELRNCCYWTIIEKGPIIQNPSTKRIRISRQNIFDPQAIIALLEKIRKTYGSLE